MPSGRAMKNGMRQAQVDANSGEETSGMTVATVAPSA